MKTLLKHQLFRLILTPLLVMGLTACGSAPEKKAEPVAPPPVILTLEISASADVNPDLEARPSPLILNMLELKAVDEFNRADYLTLTQVEDFGLGGDVLSKTEITLTPGSSSETKLELNPNTTYLGFVAGYRDIDNSRWRASQMLVPGQSGRISVTLDRQQILVGNNNK
jgi:type VI secretion system protein VasD